MRNDSEAQGPAYYKNGENWEIDILNSNDPFDSIAAVKQDGSSEVICDRLYPSGEEDYNSKFALIGRRHNIPLLDFLFANQVVRFYDGPAWQRVGATVVQGYKAVEVADSTLLATAHEGLLALDQVLEDCELHFNPRKNREHLSYSRLTALWHVKLALADYTGTMEVLEQIYNTALTGSHSSYFTLGFPVLKSMSLLALVREISQRGSSGKIAKDSLVVYQWAVRDAHLKNVQLYKELSHQLLDSHRILKISRELDTSDNRKLVEFFRESLRVRGDTATDLEKHLPGLVLAQGAAAQGL